MNGTLDTVNIIVLNEEQNSIMRMRVTRTIITNTRGAGGGCMAGSPLTALIDGDTIDGDTA